MTTMDDLKPLCNCESEGWCYRHGTAEEQRERLARRISDPDTARNIRNGKLDYGSLKLLAHKVGMDD